MPIIGLPIIPATPIASSLGRGTISTSMGRSFQRERFPHWPQVPLRRIPSRQYVLCYEDLRSSRDDIVHGDRFLCGVGSHPDYPNL